MVTKGEFYDIDEDFSIDGRENEEETERTKEKEKDVTSPLTAEELGETTGGGEQNIIATPSVIVFETVAYASM